MRIAGVRPSLGTVLACLAVGALGGMVAGPQQARRGYALRPPGAEPPTINVGEDGFRMFLDGGLGGSSELKRPVTELKHHRLHSLTRYMKDGMSSVCWNLPDGVVVVFYDHANARGCQYVIWGSGQADDLVLWRFSDRVSRWAWFYVGGVDDPSKHILRGRAPRPLGTRPTRAPVPEGGMFLYASNSFSGLRQTVSDVTAQPPGELQPITTVADGPLESLHSLRWRLPDGVIVVLYENSDLTGQQFAVWGQGELRATRRWGSDGTVAGWAWFYVGSPEALAMPEP